MAKDPSLNSSPGSQPLAQFVAAYKHWEDAPYDGIKGYPPEWVPTPFRDQFRSARNVLFLSAYEKRATYEDIQKRFDYVVQHKHGFLELAVTKDCRPYDTQLRILLQLYKAVQLGPEEGLRELAGDVAVAGLRARTGHQKRADFSAKPRVKEIGSEIWKQNPDATIKDIIYSPELSQYLREGAKRIPGTYSAKTLRTWLSEIDTRSSDAKRGRPTSRSY